LATSRYRGAWQNVRRGKLRGKQRGALFKDVTIGFNWKVSAWKENAVAQTREKNLPGLATGKNHKKVGWALHRHRVTRVGNRDSFSDCSAEEIKAREKGAKGGRGSQGAKSCVK